MLFLLFEFFNRELVLVFEKVFLRVHQYFNHYLKLFCIVAAEIVYHQMDVTKQLLSEEYYLFVQFLVSQISVYL
jgi:hypothetical protein